MDVLKSILVGVLCLFGAALLLFAVGTLIHFFPWAGWALFGFWIAWILGDLVRFR